MQDDIVRISTVQDATKMVKNTVLNRKDKLEKSEQQK